MLPNQGRAKEVRPMKITIFVECSCTCVRERAKTPHRLNLWLTGISALYYAVMLLGHLIR